MTSRRRFICASCLPLTMLVAAGCANLSLQPGASRDKLMVMVQASEDGNRQDDDFVPSTDTVVQNQNGQAVRVQAAAWDFIGNLQVRFVFDGPQSMLGATRNDLRALGLRDIKDALPVALNNLKRAYGEPAVTLTDHGVIQVLGRSDELHSGYLLDRTFWAQQAADHPRGLVVAVPFHGGLFYAPLNDTAAVSALEISVPPMYEQSGRLQISSGLFLYRKGNWSIYSDPK